jgi:hypothetical protein
MSEGKPSETNPPNFEFETKSPDVGFKDVHPTQTGGGKFKGKDTVPWGGSDGQEGLWVKCKQCGWPVNKRWNQPGSGWGNDQTEAITTIAGGTANARDPISTAGCPMCSSSEYE